MALCCRHVRDATAAAAAGWRRPGDGSGADAAIPGCSCCSTTEAATTNADAAHAADEPADARAAEVSQYPQQRCY